MSQREEFESRIRELEQQLAAAEAVIRAALAIPDRPEVVPIEETVRRHAYIKGMEVKADEFRRILSRYPVTSALTERDAEKWHEGYDQGVQDQISSDADGGRYAPARVNPYRATPTEEP